MRADQRHEQYCFSLVPPPQHVKHQQSKIVWYGKDRYGQDIRPQIYMRSWKGTSKTIVHHTGHNPHLYQGGIISRVTSGGNPVTIVQSHDPHHEYNNWQHPPLSILSHITLKIYYHINRLSNNRIFYVKRGSKKVLGILQGDRINTRG